jgi:hypothetical protein
VGTQIVKGHPYDIQNKNYDKCGKAFFTPLGGYLLKGVNKAIRASNRILLMHRKKLCLGLSSVKRLKNFLSGRLLL